MTINMNIKKALIAAAMIAAVASVADTSAFAQQDPTQGRIQSRELARKAEALKKYNVCAATAMRFFRACSGQAGNSSPMIRNCRNVYHSKLSNCSALYL